MDLFGPTPRPWYERPAPVPPPEVPPSDPAPEPPPHYIRLGPEMAARYDALALALMHVAALRTPPICGAPPVEQSRLYPIRWALGFWKAIDPRDLDYVIACAEAYRGRQGAWQGE